MNNISFSLIHKYYALLKDFTLNLMGNVIVVIVTQLCIFPLLSRYFNKSIFGAITSVYGINSIIIAFTGDSLANVRLIHNNKSGNNYDFISIIYSTIFSLIISFILFFIYGYNLILIDKILFAITTSIMSVLEYGLSLYRIKLRYNFYLFQNILVSIGYVVGLLSFLALHVWSLIFFIGNAFGLIFFIFKSGIIHEHFNITNKFKIIFTSLINISFGHLLSSTMSNLDRILMPIVLGMSYLPAFFSANTLAKMFGLIMGPLSSVLLSHLSKLDIKWKRSKLNKLTTVLTIIGLVLIIPSYFISMIIMKILYNNIFMSYDDMQLIVLFSCIATCFFEVWNILNTIYLICLKSKFQVLINLIFLFTYLLMALLLSIKYGLIGYTFGYALSIVISYVISIFISNEKMFWKLN